MLVTNWDFVYWNSVFRVQRALTQGTVRSLGAIVFPPASDDDPGFSERVEAFTVQEPVSEAGVEALSISMRFSSGLTAKYTIFGEL